MFAVGPVYTRDHGPGCSVAGERNLPQGDQEGLIKCPLSRWCQEGGNNPLQSPGGPRVRPEVLVTQYT